MQSNWVLLSLNKIKLYRAGGTINDEDHDSLDDTVDNENLSGVTSAHFDLLAESIVKLISARPA